MDFLLKVFRKLGLAKAAYAILSMFCGEKANMTLEQAYETLNKVYADQGSSAVKAGAMSTADSEIDLDIIIPCYNAEKYLNECIESVRTQKTEYKWRIIAIDDGAQDSTGAILDEYSADGRIHIIHQENRGLSGARNTGLVHSTAKYVYFLDSDDIMKQGAIEALMQCATETGADAVEGGYEVTDLKGKLLISSKHKIGSMKPEEQNGFACGVAFRRSAFADVCFPEGYWYEDSVTAEIVFPRLKNAGKIIFGIAEPVFSYRVNPEGITKTSVLKPKSLDALWIHLRMYEDRKILGIADDQSYYEYMLKMLSLTYHRTEMQPKEIRKAIFVVWSNFLKQNFAGYSTENPFAKNVEKAIADGDYGKYRLFCGLT